MTKGLLSRESADYNVSQASLTQNQNKVWIAEL